MVYLLQEHSDSSESMLKNLVTACSYISLNFKFVNSQLSLRILQGLVPILTRLLSKPPSITQTTESDQVKEMGKSATFGNRGNIAMLNPSDAFLE